MFRETLLESAPGTRRRKRWPMILAVALEVTVCSLLVALPLFSTGIIPVSARAPVIAPRLEPVTIVKHHSTISTESTGPCSPTSRLHVVTVANNRNLIFREEQTETERSEQPVNISAVSRPDLPPCDICLSTTTRPRGPDHSPYPVSNPSEGYLLHRVEPVYPRPAVLAGIRGEVRLHAIIAKDGTIQSLMVVSGHPLLARAAMDAVEQWRYRPYLLNHEPVEVETFITVNFTPAK